MRAALADGADASARGRACCKASAPRDGTRPYIMKVNFSQRTPTY